MKIEITIPDNILTDLTASLGGNIKASLKNHVLGEYKLYKANERQIEFNALNDDIRTNAEADINTITMRDV